MNEESNNQTEATSELNELSENAVSVSQVGWAWLWSSTPWLAVVGILYLTPFGGAGLDPIFGTIIVLIIVVPRFLTWRRTAYIVTDDALIYKRGGFLGSGQYKTPLSRVVEVESRDGLFGRGLGYQTVYITLDDQKIGTFATYVPTAAGLENIIRERMKPFSAEQSDTNDTTRPNSEESQGLKSDEESN